MPPVLTRFGYRQWTGLALGPLACLAIGSALAPGDAGFTAGWTAGLVALMAIWWITEPVPLWVTACLPLLVYPTLGGAPWYAVLLQYFDPVNFLFLGGMLIAASMQQWGLHRRIALGIVAHIGTGPRRIVLGFMLATGFISLWISNTATTLMMFPIGMAVLWRFEEEVGRADRLLRRFGTALMLGIAYAASIGGIGTKIGTAPNLIFVKEANQVLGIDVDFLTWVKVGLPIVLIALPAVWFYLVRVACRLPREGFAAGQQAILTERRKLGRMGAGERAALAAFLAAALLWIFRKDIELGPITVPGWWRHWPFGWDDVLGVSVSSLPAPLAKLLSQDVGDAAVAMVIGTALLLVPVNLRPFKTALSPRHAATVPWRLLVLLGGGFAMAYGIQHSGLSAWFTETLNGVGHVSPISLIVLVCLVTVLLSEFASNVATASILVPLLGASAAGFGADPGSLMIAATISASFGFMLPAGTPPNAIVYSSGYLTVPQMAASGVLVDIFGALLVAAMCYLLVPWALGIA